MMIAGLGKQRIAFGAWPRAAIVVWILFLVCCDSVYSLPRNCPEGKPLKEVRYVMGTLLEISLYAADCDKGWLALEEAFDVAQNLDSLLSNYKSDSEISKINLEAGKRVVHVSTSVYQFLTLAKSLNRSTDRAFDITVDPLMKLWRDSERLNNVPNSTELQATLEEVGSDLIELLPNQEVRLTRPGAAIDTGGLGKGFAVDRIADVLKSRGITDAFISFGESSVLAFGKPKDNSLWTVLVPFPQNKPIGLIALKDIALSVSGSMGQTRNISGRVFGHIVDPKTGELIEKSVEALVLSERASDAEALSKQVILRGLTAVKKKDFPGKLAIARVEADGRVEMTDSLSEFR